MKTSTILSISLLAIGLAAGPDIVRADSTDANCEVRKEGDKQKGKSGPCTFSQRQGYIDIDLKNGDTISLSPAGNAGRYKDQHGNKVTRSSAGKTGVSLKWDNGKHINVTWTGGYGSSSYNSYGSGGHQSGHSGSRDYGINPLDDGKFEVVFSQPFCSVYFKADGRLDHTSQDCTDDQIERATDAARRER